MAALGHGKRRLWAPAYLRGLLGPGERESLQPLAARLGLRGHDQLHHFVASPAWSDAPLRRLLVEEADALVGGPGAVLVIDDTALPKQGRHSVGVARQYCGVAGKRANRQVLVSLTLARGEVPVPVGLRLFLPEAWAADPDRCARTAAPGPGCRRSTGGPWRRPTSRSRRSTASPPPAPASAAWSRTPATARAPGSGRV
jgi:SRSO17 transposase